MDGDSILHIVNASSQNISYINISLINFEFWALCWRCQHLPFQFGRTHLICIPNKPLEGGGGVGVAGANGWIPHYDTRVCLLERLGESMEKWKPLAIPCSCGVSPFPRQLEVAADLCCVAATAINYHINRREVLDSEANGTSPENQKSQRSPPKNRGYEWR